MNQEIEQIVERIGSPYGEGATYDRNSSGPTHLEYADKKNLIEDIKSQIDQAVARERERIADKIKNLKNINLADKYGETDDDTNVWDINIERMLDDLISLIREEK